VVMRYVGEDSNLAEEQTKLERGKELIQAFLAELPAFTATTECLLGVLQEQGITQRTGERALRALCTAGILEKCDRGWYRLKQELKAI
jgi:hypothetical protein